MGARHRPAAPNLITLLDSGLVLEPPRAPDTSPPNCRLFLASISNSPRCRRRRHFPAFSSIFPRPFGTIVSAGCAQIASNDAAQSSRKRPSTTRLRWRPRGGCLPCPSSPSSPAASLLRPPALRFDTYPCPVPRSQRSPARVAKFPSVTRPVGSHCGALHSQHVEAACPPSCPASSSLLWQISFSRRQISLLRVPSVSLGPPTCPSLATRSRLCLEFSSVPL